MRHASVGTWGFKELIHTGQRPHCSTDLIMQVHTTYDEVSRNPGFAHQSCAYCLHPLNSLAGLHT